jgi:ubiquinone/menaquinone biosynthesis C-methylase UbiE
MNNNTNSTKIFSKTTDFYDKARPSYPEELFNFLENKFKINSTHVIADIGSGTGIFTRLWLDRSYHVISVEPNNDMRKIVEESLNHYPYFKSIAASAEATNLETNSIDIITAATAFHWFNLELARSEFKRILKPGGLCILIWNIRDNTFPIMQDYESMMRLYVKDYNKVVANHYLYYNEIIDLFNPNRIEISEFSNSQTLNLNAFKERILSTSYSPKLGEANYKKLLLAAENLFNKYQSSKVIKLHYKCICYVGNL